MFLPGGGPGRLTARRTLALIERLPDTSCLAAELTATPPDGPTDPGTVPAWRRHYGWGADRHLQADQWDLALAVAQGGKGRPTRYPRPTSPAQAPPGFTRLRTPSMGR